MGLRLLTGYKLNGNVRLGTLPQFTGQRIALIDLYHQRQRITGIGTCAGSNSLLFVISNKSFPSGVTHIV